MTNAVSTHGQTHRIAIINAGVSETSTSRMLAQRIGQAIVDILGSAGHDTTLSMVDLGPIATDIAQGLVTGIQSDPLSEAIDSIGSADAIIACTPVYKAGTSGLFKSFIDLLDNDLLVAKPVILAASAGSLRHSMVVDEQMRPLFAFLRSLPTPTSLFTAPEDWGSADLTKRINRAAVELSALMLANVAETILETAWDSYSHDFAGKATRSAHGVGEVDFDTDLMRLAAGGKG